MKTTFSKNKLNFDRILSQGVWKQMLLLLVMLVALFAVSFLCLSLSGDDWIHYCDSKHINKWLFPLYLLIDGNAFNDLYTNENYPISKSTLIISGITFIAGIILFTGAFISVLTNMISRRVDDHREGLIHYLKAGHHIIMGYDDMVPSFINAIFEQDPDAYVLMLSAANAQTIDERLRKHLTNKQMKHVIINFGRRASQECYKAIHLENAADIYIVGWREQPAHDALNVECVDNICAYLKNGNFAQKPQRITCVFEDLDTYAAFKTSEIFLKVRDLDIEFIPYNFYAGWANQILLKQQYLERGETLTSFDYPCVYGNGITESDPKFVHLVFVGTTNLAVAFAMEAAQLLHFPNFVKDPSKKTLITFIDINADKEMPLFLTRNRSLFEVQSYRYRDLSTDTGGEPVVRRIPSDLRLTEDFLDVDFEFIKGDIFSQRIHDELSHWAKQSDRYLSIFLAMSNQRRNFNIGMNMPKEIYDQRIPLFIRQDSADNFVTDLRIADSIHSFQYGVVKDGELHTEQRPGRYAHIYPFGMNNLACGHDEVSLRRAKLINFLYSTADYSSNKFMDIKKLNEMSNQQIWDKADEEWNNLTVALQWSNLYGAYNIPCKLASLRAMRGLAPDDTSHDLDALSDDEIQVLARVEHNRWNMEKLLMGFRKPSPEEDKYEHPEFEKELQKNKKCFIHHDLRPYDELNHVKQYDIEMVKYIPWIIKTASQLTPQ